MPLNLDEILQCEERLQAEIAERECLLAAVTVLRGYAEKGRSLVGVELGAFSKALLSTDKAKTLLLDDAAAEKPAEAAPPPPPGLPRPKPYVNPELAQLVGQNGRRHGSDTVVVRWAIERMTEDFTLNDIARLLKREGSPMQNAQISVVLTRLKRRGEIHEIRRGGGRTGALFAKPVVAGTDPNKSGGQTSGIEIAPEPVAA